MIEPAFETFERDYLAGKAQVLWTRTVADLETPVSAFLKLAENKPNCFLLESVEGGDIRGRYSIIGMKPDLIWRMHGDAAEVNRKALFDPEAFEAEEPGALASLRRLLEASRIDLPDSLPPMAAGVFGYMGYDAVRLMEHLPNENPDALGLPDGLFLRPTLIAVFDSVKDEVTLVTPVRPAEGVSAKAAYAQACDRLEDALAGFDRPVPHLPELDSAFDLSNLTDSNTPKETYYAMVERAKEYIAAGDIFQVVLSQRFEMPFQLPPFALYRALRRVNPSPYLYFLNFEGFSIVGSSPEILVRVRDERVTIRPIAGTRHRGANREEDLAVGEDLLSDEKERAEHLMLLDLGRNDVGRVSKIGSVEVTEQFALQFTSHLIHIVSNVEGDLDPSYDAISALIAGFPAGTVSGAPKVRAMEIIDELELEKRGPYAGCVGYFTADGDMDTCIVLRTAVVKDGKIYVQAGGGVVADSTPEYEYQETINKAKALVRAAEEAVRYATQSPRRQ